MTGLTTWVFWGGPKPPIYQLCLQSILEHNEDVTILDEKAAREMGADFIFEAAHNRSWQVKTDLLRLWLLREHGGQWIDADCIALQRLPLTDYLDKFDFVGFGDNDRWPVLSNAVMASQPGGRIVTEAFSRAMDIVRNSAGQQIGYGATGQGVLRPLYQENRDAVRRFQRWRFAPIPWYRSGLFHRRGKDRDFERSALWNPNAYLYHLTGKPITPYRRWLPKRLLRSQRFISFLLRKSRGQVLPLRSRSIVEHLPRGPLRGAELGVADGWNARILLQQRPELHLTLVDLWEKNPQPDPIVQPYQKYPPAWHKRRRQRAIFNTGFARHRVQFEIADTAETAAKFPDASFDFVFVDGLHTYDQCRKDIDAWLPKLKPGALLCGHDYARQEPTWGVRKAVDETANRLNKQIEPGADSTWFIRL